MYSMMVCIAKRESSWKSESFKKWELIKNSDSIGKQETGEEGERGEKWKLSKEEDNIK